MNPIKPPNAKKIPKEIKQHNQTRVDNYAWLRDKNWKKFIEGDLDFHDPSVKEYLESEQAYTKQIMDHTQSSQKQIYDEILSRIVEDDISYPYQKGNYYYIQETKKGLNYPILQRKFASIDAETETYFDINKESENYDTFILGTTSVNKDGTYFAYTVNTTGSMSYSLKLKDLAKNEHTQLNITDLTDSFQWVDNENIFYIERDESGRGKTVCSINIHKGLESRQVLFTKPTSHDDMFLDMTKTPDGKYIFLHLNNGSDTVIHFKPSDSDAPFQLFVEDKDDIQYSITHKNGSFYILTNLNDKHNFMIMTCPVEDISKPNWKIFLDEEKDLYLETMALYNKYLIACYKNTATSMQEIFIINILTHEKRSLKFSTNNFCFHLIGNDDPNSYVIRFSLETPIQPSTLYDLNLESLKKITLKKSNVPNYDTSEYQTEILNATSSDGQKIPITIIYKQGTLLNSKNPLLLYGYGSYGLGITPTFNQQIFSLINRGFIYAIAHIRGGDEKGYNWYRNGKKELKKNTFEDYLSVCHFLIDQKYTKAGLITGYGGSAGGLLMGAVANMEPSIFKSIIAAVPFVDVVNTISDASLPLTPPEWEEWGNPILNKEDFEYILSYSPYDNIKTQSYPNILALTGISDEQVTYWEPAKWVAKLRELKTDNNLLLLDIKMNSGHTGASKRYQWIKDKAFEYAFILKAYQ